MRCGEESLRTQLAMMISLIVVHLDVNIQVGTGLERLRADFTCEEPFFGMNALAMADE
jgi:hypothetical protein